MEEKDLGLGHRRVHLLIGSTYHLEGPIGLDLKLLKLLKRALNDTPRSPLSEPWKVPVLGCLRGPLRQPCSSTLLSEEKTLGSGVINEDRYRT